jgi:hypothetical protein
MIFISVFFLLTYVILILKPRAELKTVVSSNNTEPLFQQY